MNVLCFAGTCWSDGMGTITTASSLNWSERVLSRQNSLRLNGWANAVTFDLPNRIDRWMGRTGPEAQAWLESQSEYQSGSKAGVVSSMVVPSGGPLRGLSALAKAVNVTSRARTIQRALTLGEKWVGHGYSEIAPGVFRSANGLRQFRMTNADLLSTHGKIGPHVHFEVLNSAGKVIRNIHTPLIP